MPVKSSAAALAQRALCHTALRVFITDNTVVIQAQDRHEGGAEGKLETLTIDLGTGAMEVQSSAAIAGHGVVVLGILGLCRLYTGYALVVVTAAQQVASVRGRDVFRVAGSDVLTGLDGRAGRENRKLVRLLADAVDPQGAGRGLFFSYAYDITLSAQRLAEAMSDPVVSARPLSARADPRFAWNRAMMQPLVEGGAGKFVLPTILGFVRQLVGLSFARPGQPARSSGSATLTLIARRSPNRAGTRHWRRGCDTEGNAANYVETEQLLTVDGEEASLSSFVELRGSIPLLWTQLPNINYKPTTVIAPPADSAAAFDLHFKGLEEQYLHVVAINLINQKGGEGKLAAAFKAEAERYIAASPTCNTRYVAFDFQKQCGEKNYHRLSRLWDEISVDFLNHGFFLMEQGVVVRRQQGIMRINCIDCLDRTNVVQSVFGRHALEMVLRYFELLPAAATLPANYPAVELKFKVLWADHGDQLATQYAGTGAMKSGFTRSGVRTYGGMLDDGLKAVRRYYLNNFKDGRKQDAVDLFTGHYTVDPSVPLPVRVQPSPVIPMLLALLAIAYSVHSATHLLVPPAAQFVVDLQEGRLECPITGLDDDDSACAVVARSGVTQLLGTALRGVLAPFAMGAGVLMYVAAHGKNLVNRPQLCPQLAQTVARKAVPTLVVPEGVDDTPSHIGRVEVTAAPNGAKPAAP